MNKNKVIRTGRRVVRLEHEAIKDLNASINEGFVRAVELIFNSNGRVIVTGLGKSGAIARKISATLTSTGTPAYFLHAAEGVHGDLGMVHKNDIVICISKSGETEELFGLLTVFKRLGIPIIAMTGEKDSTLGKHADVLLDVKVKEEACPHNLAPTTSTTATLVMGDALAIALLEQRNFSKEDFAFLHPGGSLGKKLLLTVDDLMEKGDRIAFCFEHDTMKKVTIEMAHKRGICLVVNDKMNVLGVITTGDLNRLLEQTESFFHLKASEVMNTNPKTIKSGTLAAATLKKMEEYRVIAVPVMDSRNRLVGIVHLHDILQAGITN